MFDDIKISLASARKNANLTQREVAKTMKKNVKTIVNWENGTSVPSIIDALELSELYQMPIDKISFCYKNSTF